MIDTARFRKRVVDNVEEENERLANSRMVGMNEALVADWFVVLVEKNGAAESDEVSKTRRTRRGRLKERMDSKAYS